MKCVNSPLWLLLLSLFSGGCVTVAVQSTNRDSEAGDAKNIRKLTLVAYSNGEYVDFYSKLNEHLKDDLSKRQITVETFVFRKADDAAEQEQFAALLKKSNSGHLLNIRQASSGESQDGSHHKEEARLQLTLSQIGQEKHFWQSVIEVNSGGVLGFGTIGTGAGNKLTAQKIILQMEQDKLIPVLPDKK